VCAVRLGHGFGRSGSHLQACQFLPACTREGAQRRPRIGAQRNRASPRTAQIVYGAFVSRLSYWHRGYWDLGLWGPAGPTDVLSQSRAFRGRTRRLASRERHGWRRYCNRQRGEAKMFIAMNRFRGKKGAEQEFEKVWPRRETQLHNVPG